MGEPRVRFWIDWPRARCQDNSVTDPEREKRWAELFDQLDLNKDGRIDANELRTGLAAWGVPGDVEEVRNKFIGKYKALFGQISEDSLLCLNILAILFI